MLEGKVAVVTGASGGIGRAIAVAFGKVEHLLQYITMEMKQKQPL